MTRIRRALCALLIVSAGGGLIPTHVLAANNPTQPTPVVIVTDTTSGVFPGVPVTIRSIKVDPLAHTLAFAPGCSYGQYTQHSTSWLTGITLGSHTLRTNYCWTGTAISGTPAITIHTVSTTNYGSALGVRLRNDGTTGPSKLSSYQWTTTGYVTYLQCVQGTGACTGGSQHYIIINPQGSGNYGVAAA